MSTNEKKEKCDKYDYLVSAGCGAVGGIIDIFFVGAPGDSLLSKWSDEVTDNFVKTFAKKFTNWNGNGDSSISAAIDHIEKFRKVGYDDISLPDIPGMYAGNHHMKSLEHSPDIVGLFFCILNQFTHEANFVSEGKIIPISIDTEGCVYGHDFISNIYCGFTNWIIHIISDIAGASGARRKGNYGSGIVIPFYELFGFCNFGKFKTDNGVKTLAEIATTAFQTTSNQRGMDFRFGMAMAIPVFFMDVSIRLFWSIRRHFQYGLPVKDCIPTDKHADLRMMLLVGNGTLCVFDGVDAFVRSGGNAVAFFMRLNLVAWVKLVMMILKEVCIRLLDNTSIGELQESKKRLKEMQELLLTVQEQEKRYREQFSLKFDTIFDGDEKIINKAFEEMSDAISNSDVDGFIMELGNIGKAFGIDYKFESFEEIDANMSNPNFVFKL